MKKEKYIVWQALYRDNTIEMVGDKKFTNKRLGKKYFNEIKKDTKGWNYGTLVTSMSLGCELLRYNEIKI